MSRKRNGRGSRSDPPQSKEEARAQEILGPMRDSDRETLHMLRGKMTMRIDGKPVEVTRGEAVRFKTLQSALEGNSHAAWLILSEEEAAEEAERKRIADIIAYWLGIQRLNQAILEEAQKLGAPEPVVIPHPDDMHFDPKKGIEISGPIDAAEHSQMLDNLGKRDALLVQYVMECVVAGRRWLEPEDQDCSALRLAVIFNGTLPKRKRWIAEEFNAEVRYLFARPKRELLKRAHSQMSAAGMKAGRGKPLDPTGQLGRFLKAAPEVFSGWLSRPDISLEEIVEGLTELFARVGIKVSPT